MEGEEFEGQAVGLGLRASGGVGSGCAAQGLGVGPPGVGTGQDMLWVWGSRAAQGYINRMLSRSCDTVCKGSNVCAQPGGCARRTHT